MCTNPIKIYNRSSKLSLRGSALYFTVPCGECEECKKVKQNEYTVRSYFEYRSCEAKGGYAYFDTLTYSPEYLPKTYGIAHFNRDHITLFLKELRIYLTRSGYDVKNNIKYFITSEYGGKTHRPHYHILLFITVPRLDVNTLWHFINKSWKFGLIDRQSTAPNRVINSTAAINYVAKYVSKDQEWQEVVDKKLYRLRKLGLEDKFQDKLKSMKPFHRQSQGYGAGFLQFSDLDYIIQNGTISLPDKNYLRKDYSIPKYYERKLFYQCVREDDKYRWKLTPLGIDYKVKRLDSLIEKVAKDYTDIIDNLDAYNIADTFDTDTVRNLISRYLGSRTINDLVTYLVVYKDKLLPKHQLLPNYKEFYRLSLQEGTTESRLYDESLNIRSSYRSRLSQNIITQYRFPQFVDFDNLYHLVKAVTDYAKYGKDEYSKEAQTVRDRLKLLLDVA